MRIIYPIIIAVMSICSVHASEPATIYYTTNGSEPIITQYVDPIQVILDGNPICPEWARKYDKYSPFALDYNGLEWRLHRWVCLPSGQVGWTPEPIGKHK